jgi:hypothetical protein
VLAWRVVGTPLAAIALVAMGSACDSTKPRRLGVELKVQSSSVPGGSVEVLVRATPDSGDRIATISRDVGGDVLTFPGPGVGGEGVAWQLRSGSFLPKRNGPVRIVGSATTVNGVEGSRDTTLVLADTTPPRVSFVFSVPALGATLVRGSSVQLSYAVFDDVEVKSTTLRVNGAFTFVGAPQSVGDWARQIYVTVVVPPGAIAGTAIVSAEATDWEGRTTSSVLGTFQVGGT